MAVSVVDECPRDSQETASSAVTERPPTLFEEFRRTPVSLGLCATWILVFVAMLLWQGNLQSGRNAMTTGVRSGVGHVFGDQKALDLRAWQLWRPLTATCIHFSLLHLVFNLILMYQLGPMLESWYGSRLFLAMCVAMGFLGNLLAGAARLAAASGTRLDTGGGSSVLCGLIALLAVVGWRSRTRFGEFIRAQMVALLVFIAVFGLVVEHIDNYGHAGGAFVGALIGLLHRPLLRAVRGWKATAAFTVTVLACLTCVAFQVRAGVREAVPLRRQHAAQKREQARQILCDLLNVGALYVPAAELPPGALEPGYLRLWDIQWQDPELRTFLVVTADVPHPQRGDLARSQLLACGERLGRSRSQFASGSNKASLDRLLGLVLRAAELKATSEDERQCQSVVEPLLRWSWQHLLDLGTRRAGGHTSDASMGEKSHVRTGKVASPSPTKKQAPRSSIRK
jgi:membrane associated rhomboid family serine protease